MDALSGVRNYTRSRASEGPVASIGAAKSLAKAIASGLWKCAQVKAWVKPEDCVLRRLAAREKGGYSPCLECSIGAGFEAAAGLPKRTP